MSQLHELFEMFQKFSLETYPEAKTPKDSLEKLKEEFSELRLSLLEDPSNREEVREEYVDCIMCLLSSMSRAGIQIEDLRKSFQSKLIILQARKWKYNGNGTYSHIK